MVRTTAILMLLLPLLGALVNGLVGWRLPRRFAGAVACGAVLASLGVAAVGFVLAALHRGTVEPATLAAWFSAGGLTASMDVLYDRTAAAMALMVTFVSSLVHLYSVGYMHREDGWGRYWCYLNLFVFSMLVIVLADNLVFLFLGWEGVGLCSWGLIGFWNRDMANVLAGRKAFLLTRIGDVGFLVAIGLLYAHGEAHGPGGSGYLSVAGIAADPAGAARGAATLLGLLLLWAAAGKSAQLPLLVWLPDAMAGPTPVSALIHAATMVTAGVYLLIRLFPLLALSPVALGVIAVAGAATALYGACAALAQRDIKRILAYSTISQVGYMVLGVGASDPTGSMFHLLSHAFFKALLFMAVGCVTHALADERNVYRMGGYVRRLLPGLFPLFAAGILALAAVPPSAGFFSKGRVLASAFAGTIGGSGPHLAVGLAWAMGTVAAFLTGLYAFRLAFLAFFGEPALGRPAEAHRIPAVMTLVLYPLAGLALVAGLMDFPGLGWLSGFLSGHGGEAGLSGSLAAHTVEPSAGLEWAVGGLDAVLALAAALLAWRLYGPAGTRRSPARLDHPLGLALASGFGLDRLYTAAIGRPYARLAGPLWTRVDEGGVDEAVEATARGAGLAGAGLGAWATGRVSMYVLMLLAGLAGILVLLALTAGAS